MKNIVRSFNQWWRENTPRMLRGRWLILVLVLLADGLGFIGMKRIRTDDSFDSWLIKGDPLLLAKDRFEGIFGNPEYVCILIESDNLFDRVLLGKMRLMGDRIQHDVPLVDDVTSLTQVDFIHGTTDGIQVGELVPDPVPENREALEALHRMAATKPHLVNRMFREDGGSGMVVVRLLPYPDDCTESAGRSKVARAIYKILAQPEFADLHVTTSGLPIINHEKSQFYSKEGGRLILMTIAVIALLLGVTMRSPVGVLAPLFTAISAVLMVFGLQGFIGLEVQAMVIAIPVMLLLVISVGYSIHVLSFFQQHFRRYGGRAEAIAHALEHAAWPLLFTVLTTVGGFLSFLFVPITAIRWIGVSSAMMTLVSYPLVVFLTPVLLSFGRDRPPQADAGNNRQPCSRSDALLLRLADWVERHPKGILYGGGIISFVLLICALPMKIDTDLKTTDGLRVPYVRNIFHCAEDIGSLYSYDITIILPEEDQVKEPERLRRVDQLAEEMMNFSTVKRTTSITDIVRDLNQTLHEGDSAYYTIPDEQAVIAQLLLLYEMSGGSDQEDWVDYEYRRMRLQVELADFKVSEARRQLTFVRERAAELFPDAEILVSGQVLNFVMLCSYLVHGQLLSVAAALAVIAIVMMLVFGSIRLGLIAMIPNVVPIMAMAGVMGITGIPLHLLSVMIAPMIIGLAVDDTIHFITHFKQTFERTGSYHEANRETLRSVGRAMFLTSFIIMLGFGMFGFSRSNGYVHLALLTAVAVITALLADYLITPTLIMRIQPWGPGKRAERTE